MAENHRHHELVKTTLVWLALAGTLWATSTLGREPTGDELMTPPHDLVSAIHRQKYDTVLGFIDAPEALTATNEDGDTALHLAVRRGAGILIELLLAHGADPQALNQQGQTPANIMRDWPMNSMGRRQVTDALIQYYENPEATSSLRQAQLRFFMAVTNKDLERARAALAAGADPNGTRTYLEQTVMHQLQYDRMIGDLVSMGVDLNRVDSRGATPLRVALDNNRWRGVRALLNAGATINVDLDQSDLASVIGSSNPNATELVKLLLSSGAPVRQSEWMSAMRSKNGKTVRLLVAREDRFEFDSGDWELRIAEAVRMGGETVMAALRSEPQLADYIDNREREFASAREQQLAAFGSWIGPHGFVLSQLMVLFALLSSLAARTVCQNLAPYLALVGAGTLVMTHLFIFTAPIETALGEFRFFGERTPALRYLLYLLLDGSALTTGLGVAFLAWKVLDQEMLRGMLVIPAWSLLIVTLSILFLHNAQKISWPSGFYRQVTGYDDYIAKKAQQQQHEKQQQSIKRAAARKLEQEKQARENHLPLFAGIKQQDATAVGEALSSGVPVDTRDRSGRTALFYASELGASTEIVGMLLLAGADVRPGADGATQPIHVLLYGKARESTLEILKLLLDAGADPNARTLHGETPLCIMERASWTPLASKVRNMLVAHGARFGHADRCALALYKKDPNIVEKMEAGAAVLNERQEYAKLTDQFGQYRASALWQAAHGWDVEYARLLLDLGADIESRDTKRGMTPLQAAIYNSRYRPEKGRPMVALLLSRGANREAVAWDGATMAELDEHDLLDRAGDGN
jgi:ankyrin repeat protein